jgi:tRNA threonylcarbamoyladenosine biosynthesis protein TsaE
MFEGKGKPAQIPSGTTTIRSSSPEETFQFGVSIGATVRSGTLLLLRGPIGAGKSVVAAGLASALGVESFRGSPTFSLVHEYCTEPSFYHVDLYRLEEREIEDLGLCEYARPDSVVAVEWADRAPTHLAGIATGEVIWIGLEITGPEERIICVTTGVADSRSGRSSRA